MNIRAQVIVCNAFRKYVLGLIALKVARLINHVYLENTHNLFGYFEGNYEVIDVSELIFSSHSLVSLSLTLKSIDKDEVMTLCVPFYAYNEAEITEIIGSVKMVLN